jgi:hypothetical protein
MANIRELPVYVVAIDGLSANRPLDMIDPTVIAQAEVLALNATADKARTMADKAIRAQVNFPASYLHPSEQRLYVAKRASEGSRVASIVARTRPTMLARFVTSGSPAGGGRRPSPISLAVRAGGGKTVSQRMFLISLPAGRGGDPEDNPRNMGLAIRLKPGEVIHNKKVMARIKGNLYILYGPSVSSVFATVREDISPDTLDFLETEFARQVDRLA